MFRTGLLIVLAIDASNHGSHPGIQIFLHLLQSFLMIGIGSQIVFFFGIIDQIVKLKFLSVDSVKFPGPIVPSGVAIRFVFWKLRKLVDVFFHPLWVVGQGGFGLLFFHNRFENPIAPCRLAGLELMPITHRLAPFF